MQNGVNVIPFLQIWFTALEDLESFGTSKKSTRFNRHALFLLMS